MGQQQQQLVAADFTKCPHAQVVHCDVKTQNVLLTETWDTAKIADVGVAQLLGNYNPDNVGWTFACASAGCILLNSFTLSVQGFSHRSCRVLLCTCMLWAGSYTLRPAQCLARQPV